MIDLEGERLEFKEARKSYPFDKLLRYCAAIANEGGGRIILGITDKRPQKIVGTQAFSQPERTRAGLMEKLRLNVDVDVVRSSEGRILVFTVPPRPVGIPIQADGIYWTRRGDSLVPMTEDQRHSRSQIQVLLRELVKDGKIHSHGLTRAARWFPGPEKPNCNH